MIVIVYEGEHEGIDSINHTLLYPLPPELIFMHAGVNCLPAHGRGVQKDSKFCYLPEFQK